jgi:hypothetical protein
VSEHQHEPGWRPDQPQPGEYPPPAPPPPEPDDDEDEPDGPQARDMTAQRPGDKPTAWQRAMAERKAAQEANDPGDADDLGNEVVYRPPASGLTDEGRRELRRCADAFENTAKRLREIVGNE